MFFSTYSAGDGSAPPGTTASPQNSTTGPPSNSTATITPTSVFSRNNPCSHIRHNDAAQDSCNQFFNNETASGDTAPFATAFVVSNARELVSAVENARPGGAIVVLAPGTYTLTKELKPTQRIALVGIKTSGTRPKITTHVALHDGKPEALVSLSGREGASVGFYSTSIHWETSVNTSDAVFNDYRTISGVNYPGEVRLYDNVFTHESTEFHIGDFVYLNDSKVSPKKIVIDSNRFNTSNLNNLAVYSGIFGSDLDQNEIVITNNTLTSGNGASDDVSMHAFQLDNYKKFTIENNIALNKRANASILINLPDEPGLEGSIKDNKAHIDASPDERTLEILSEASDVMTGLVTVSGNDYFDVDYGDEIDAYIAFTSGKEVPARSSSAIASLSPTSATAVSSSASITPEAVTNPCDGLSHDAVAQKACNDFLSNPLATGGDKDFAHAFVVRNARELYLAVEDRDYLDSGSIIVLHEGLSGDDPYLLSKPLRIDHKVALVGASRRGVKPKIQASEGMFKTSGSRKSLVRLRDSSSQRSSGFYSFHIHWEASIGEVKRGSKNVDQESAISSDSYRGKIRIYDNLFLHRRNNHNFGYFLMLQDASGDIYIGHNDFDDSHLTSAVIKAQCSYCAKPGTKVEIVSNHFQGRDGDKPRTTVPPAVYLRGYNQFRIENNQQDNKESAAQIDVYLKNQTMDVSGVIRNNIVESDTSTDQKTIRIQPYMVGAGLVIFTGTLTVTGNTNYILSDPRHLMALLGLTGGAETIAQASSTTQPPLLPSRVVVQTSAAIMPTPTQPVIASRSTTSSPTPAIPSSPTPSSASTAICDHMPSSTEITPIEINACKEFLNNTKASAGQSFSKALVVSNAEQLEAAIGTSETRDADDSTLIVLKNGTYRLRHGLEISHKIALVGTVKNGQFPIIRISDVFESSNLSLVYLYHDSAVAETGFYSHHIHWDTTNSTYRFGLLYNGAIFSESYQGEVRIYGNQFSESQEEFTAHYIKLQNVMGGTFVGNNWFDTSFLKTAAVVARCATGTCITAGPQLEVSDNHFHNDFIPSIENLKAIYVLGYANFRIVGNQQGSKNAAGLILIRDHNDIEHMNGYVINNIAHKDAPDAQRKIIFESTHDPEHLPVIFGELIVSGNDYYTFDDRGLAWSHIEYTLGKQVIASSSTVASSTVKAAPSASVAPGVITPTRLLVSASASVNPLPVKKKPCNDVSGHSAAFAACEAFLQNELASGPAASKPEFSHAFAVATVSELIDAINKTIGEDGRAIRGRIILLKAGNYELSGVLKISHRTAMVGLEGEVVERPVIKPADDYYHAGAQPSLLYLSNSYDSPDAGFYSWNLEWQTRKPSSYYGYPFESHILANSYSGDIRIYQNHFTHYETGAWSAYAVALNDNPGYKYYVGYSFFDSSLTPVSVVRSSANTNPQAAIEVDSNVFATARNTDLSQPRAIDLSDYQHLKINNNLQADRHAAGVIMLKFVNDQKIESASVKNNRAHKDAPEDARFIELRLQKGLTDSAKVHGYVDVTGNDYYELEILDFSNYRYTRGLEVAIPMSTSLTPSQPVQTASVMSGNKTPEPAATRKVLSTSRSSMPTPLATTVVPSATASVMPTTSPVFSSPCDQLTVSGNAQLCQQFLSELQDKAIKTTFSEAVMVKNTGELLHELASTSESGKVILLQAGSYALDRPLSMSKPVALVGIGNPVIKQSVDYPAKADSLVLLDYDSTAQGFYSKGMTWDISAADGERGNPLSTAIKAINYYEGELLLLMSGDEFQYNAIRKNEKAPSHYIEIQDSTGDVLITGSTFFLGGLTKAAIYANCDNCLKDNQKLVISGNRFTDSNSGETAPTAIEVRHYRTLKVHDNVQETESVSVNINVVLPNNKDDITAFVYNNMAMGSAIDGKKTIDLSVGRLAKEPARIDGLVQVYNNRCFSVNHVGIPSDVLELVEADCPALPATLPDAQALRESSSNSGMSTGGWVGTGFAVAAAAYCACGVYGYAGLPGHARAKWIFSLPAKLALAAGAKVFEWCHRRNGYKHESEVLYQPSPMSKEMETLQRGSEEVDLGLNDRERLMPEATTVEELAF
ncbi:hypothetical protein [Endozoicomonas sp. 4G]|uniref:hypothetical protein n=1 Tax=Endozoicomonas sp. 4G TaxID=2872754 RepID=UPI002078BB07|nr:hypothetical protein [Endozoicomonas sp. 4G]